MQSNKIIANNTDIIQDVVIIGGGASGSALLYTLAKYTDIKNITLLEKYAELATVNSAPHNNSQTLHVGDIETNYSFEKVKQVKPAAMMVVGYTNKLPDEERSQIIKTTPKMVIGVGEKEVSFLEERFNQIKVLFPELKKLSVNEIQAVEPEVMRDRNSKDKIVALYSPSGYSVNFQQLAKSLVSNAVTSNPNVSLQLSTAVKSIEKTKDGLFNLILSSGAIIQSKVVIVDADSYSLLLAKQMGYGLEYSLIPIAGTFYFSPKKLNGKVYTVQNPELPFAAVHGDPDLMVPNKTRWGPTARFHPVLEARNLKTSLDYLRASGLNRINTWISFIKILLNPIRLKYLLENMLYELPIIGTRMFLKNACKITPSLTYKDITSAKGYGGMRLQRVNTKTQELELGEGKIVGDNIVFNMTPSPGASVCLYNALRDVEIIIKFLGKNYTFKKQEMECDLLGENCSSIDTSLPVSLRKEGYPS